MTVRDRRDIKRLYYFNNYLQSTLARLYGLSQERIRQILHEDQSVSFNTGTECILCSNDEYLELLFIDGNDSNNKPQNVIMLCEVDKRRIGHLQLRRKEVLLKSLI